MGFSEPGRLLGIYKAGVTYKNPLHLIRFAYKSLGVNQAEAAPSEILMRTRVPLTVDRFAARAVGIARSMVSAKHPQSEFLVSHTKKA